MTSESSREAQRTVPGRPRRGRDHLNLAEFPISVLQRQQPADDGGRKLDTVTFRASRWDRRAGRHVPQTVTLTTNSRSGLPTPADENVVLALLYLTLRLNDFSDPKVHFSPWQLFGLMGWSKNGRSYRRLREVLRRLKSLTVTYENAWWDNEGRRFEEEFATGIVGAYRIARQTAGRKRPGSVPGSWVLWNGDFFESLAAGSLKRLNLEQLFALQRPTAQRMYRFLDKHFYHSDALEFELREFACGHVGLAESYDTGQLKTKLRPAIAELEDIGFIAPAQPSEQRYYRQEKRLTFPHQGKTRDVIPDAGFLLAVHPAGEEGTSQNARPSMLLHFVEMDNGTMSLKRVLSKLRGYDLWSRSEEGRAYLTGLYRTHGARNPRPNFRLLIVCHDKAGLHSGGDARRELDVFAQCLELPKQMRERVWLTTVERLRRHQDDDSPLAASLWLRARDARAWLPDYRAYTASLPRGRGQKRYHRQRQFVAERLAELPVHALFPKLCEGVASTPSGSSGGSFQ